jgi:hypothetical protein
VPQRRRDARTPGRGGPAGVLLTAPATKPAEQAASAGRAGNLALLKAAEPGPRRRRTIDAVLLAVGAVLVALGAVIAESAPAQDERVEQAFVTVLGWAPAVWRVALVCALVLALAIVADALFRRRWDLVRDLVVALLGVVGMASVLGRLVEADWLPIEADLWSRWGFPELRLAVATAVLAVAGPELVRPVRVLATWLVPLAALGTVALEAVSPAGALGGLALGLAVAAFVRLAFGSTAGVPPTALVGTALATLGVEVSDLRISERQRIGAAEYLGHDMDGGPLKVRVLGRDAQDTQRLARNWRLLVYRDPPRSVAAGRLD